MYKEIIVGKLGITNQRKFIAKYFKEGQYVVSMDDDIEEVLKLKGSDKLVKVNNLDVFFNDAYRVLKEEELYIWGIYPVRNAFFMKNEILSISLGIVPSIVTYILSSTTSTSTEVGVKYVIEDTIVNKVFSMSPWRPSLKGFPINCLQKAPAAAVISAVFVEYIKVSAAVEVQPS
jgi:hypothetical protein